MVNSNPETVSTDFDISDALYFEPLTLEDVLEIVARRAADGRGGPARRADAAQAGARARARGRADPGHVARGDRPGRGPRAVRGDHPRAGRGAAAERRGLLGGRGGGRRGAGGLSGAGPALLRARRARDGDRLRRRLAPELLRARGAGGARAPGADRQLPRGCVRGRRGRHRRRHPLRDRRGDAAHRGRRHPLRRLGLRAPALPHHRAAGRGDAPAHPRLRRAAGRGGTAQRPVRHQERHRLRARGEPARRRARCRSSPRRPACRSPAWPPPS